MELNNILMVIDKEFAKSVKVFLAFIVGLIIIVLIRKCTDVKEPAFSVKKVAYFYKKPIDLNLTDLSNGQRLFYEQLNEAK